MPAPLRRALDRARRSKSRADARAVLAEYAETEVGRDYAHHPVAERAVMIEARTADLLTLAYEG